MNKVNSNTHKQVTSINSNGNSGNFRFSGLVLPFYLPSAFMFLGSGMVLPILALYARNLGASIGFASFVVGLFGFGNLIFNIPAGFLIARFGNRRILLITTVSEATLALIIGFTKNIWVLAILLLFLGMLHTVFFVSRLSFFRTLVPAESRGRALALIGGENRMGQFLGPIAGGMIAQNFGYQYTFWTFAALLYLSMFFLLKWVPETGKGSENRVSENPVSRIAVILKENRKIFSTAGLAVIILQLLRTARQAIVPLAGESLGLSVSKIGFVIGIMYFAEILLFYPAGIIMDRWGRKATAVPCLILFSLGIVLLPFAASFTGMIIFVVIAGIGNGLGSGINMTLSTDFAPDDNPAEFIGVWRLIVDTGTAGGPFLVGLVATVMSLGAASFATGIIGFAGAAVMAVLVAEPLKR